ncbi:BTB/POZ domain [Nesidiocoris tenuis]|uniref:BTB/POZ domain n=1 Tax=Nesidiocoris tenuis TaxID=355587 RepID=A0ABN7B0Z4_9HEMI|nr:BTB/POZ domain [Nesidiocoris tenuis]
MAAGAGRAPTQASQALRDKAAAELDQLNCRLHDQLKQDISRVYTDCLFADLHLLFHSGCVRTHKSLLETRAPRFYRELINRCAKVAKSDCLLDRLTVRLIETFVREIYTKNVIKHKEDAVVAQIKVRGVKDVDSPVSESEVFLTPKASPCEPLPQEVPLPAPTCTPDRTNYYSIVHLGEDLERELAEQDALSNSFRSILIREVSRQPTTLDFTKASPEVKDVEREIEAKRAQALKVLNKQFTYSVDYEMSWAKESSLAFREEELTINSSGYITGGSPKTDPTRGEDSVTEVASGEDIPHDGQSPASATSDQGTWDPYGQDGVAALTNPKTLHSPTADIPARIDTEPVKNNFFIDASSLIDENEYPPLEIGKFVEPKTESQLISDTKPDSPHDTKANRVLIRRNTFELDPDDEKLALLKEEYEKANGYKVKSEAKEQPASLPILPIVAHDDDHSPDSLNCDPFDLFINQAKQPITVTQAENIEEAADSKKSPAKVEIDSNHLSLELSAFSNMSNSSEPSSSLSASGVSSKRENDTTEETSSKEKSDCIFNRFENLPIVSGAAPLSDFSASDVSLTSSPLTRRKNEFAPILSGGFDIPIEEPPKKVPSRAASSMNTSWVVDMSDVVKEAQESLEAKEKPKNNGMGFFVPLDDPYPSIDSVMSNSSERSDSNKRSDRNSSCGFYVDLKTDSDSENGSKKKDIAQPEKKLFSMFIDIGNNQSKDSSTPRSKPGSPFLQQKRPKAPNFLHERLSGHKKSTSTSSDSGLDIGEHPEQTKGRMLFDSSENGPASISDGSTTDSAFSTKRQSFYMFIETDESPVPRRRTLPSGLRNPVNRHSWNSDKKFDGQNVKVHKRSSSISYDGSLKLESNSDSGPQSIDESQKKTKMDTSWHGPVKPSSELSRIIQNGARHEFEKKAKKSAENQQESMDVPDELSCSLKSDDYESSNDNRTFVIDDVSKAVNISSNDLELSTPSHDIVSDLSKDNTETDLAERKSTGSSKSIDNDVTPKQDDDTHVIVTEEPVSFVKLSDMDVQPDAKVWEPKETSRSTRMTRSIPSETSAWMDNSRVLANSSSSRSLSRLFPHLYPTKTSDGNSDTEPSNTSSMQSSSVGPSLLDSSEGNSEDSCGPGGSASSRLGQDLLRMFLDGISPDVTIDVGGRRIKAHKCILSSRCQYFAGMLSGGWVESAGNVISLQGFSYNAVHFALCHIYSGASNIPETINIVELATLADMLCLEGLKEVIMYTLKVKYCHFFHKPCAGCTVGVLECLPLAAAYGLDEIYRKTLRWTTRYFVRVWPTKGFASLPKELQDKCYKQHIVHMGSENVLDTIMGCEKLEATIPNVRWAQPVLSLNGKLHEAAIKYLTQHFSNVVSSEAFTTIGKEDVWTVTRLEETLLRVSRNLSPDQSCQSYRKIKALLAKIHRTETEDVEWKIEFLELLTQLETSIEECLVRQAGRAARTSSWAQMDISLRKKIQELACLVFAPGPRSASVSKSMEGRSPRLSERSHSRPPMDRTAPNRSSSVTHDHHHAASGPSSITQHTAASLSKSKATSQSGQRPVAAQRVASAPAAARRSLPAKPSAPAPSTSSQPARNITTPQPSASSLPRPRVNPKFSQVKPRYLEPKPPRKDLDSVVVNGSGGRRLSGGGRPLSSSDSSRTSSPAANRVARSRPSTAGSNKSKTPLGNTPSHVARRSGSGGNPSPSSVSSAGTGGNSSKISRNMTFRVATKSSQAKVQSPRQLSARHPHIAQRSGTFLKESPTSSKKSPGK